jgi:hypothetical protein
MVDVRLSNKQIVPLLFTKSLLAPILQPAYSDDIFSTSLQVLRSELRGPGGKTALYLEHKNAWRISPH